VAGTGHVVIDKSPENCGETMAATMTRLTLGLKSS